MMAETSCFHPSTMTARRLRQEGKFGRIYYTQGDYIHNHGTYLAKGELPKYLERMFFHDGKRTWRYGNAQGLYLTHASGPVIHVTGEGLVEVAAIGTPMDHPFFKENQYGNPFLNTTFFFKTSGGNSSRVNIHWWTSAPGREGADFFWDQNVVVREMGGTASFRLRDPPSFKTRTAAGGPLQRTAAVTAERWGPRGFPSLHHS